jgi:hypothetical protein
VAVFICGRRQLEAIGMATGYKPGLIALAECIGKRLEPLLLLGKPLVTRSLESVSILKLESSAFTAVAPLAFTVSACIFFGSKAASPLLFPDVFQGRAQFRDKPVLSEDAKVAEFHLSVLSTLFPSWVVPVFALPAVWINDDSVHTLMTAKAPHASHIALGVSLGYMGWDLLTMLWKHEACIKAMKVNVWRLMVFHHSGSLMIWPYCILNGRGALFVNWFMLSEATNVGMNLRYLLIKTGNGDGCIFTLNGIGWLTTWLALRLLPIPYLLHRLIRSNRSGLNTAESIVATLMVPIPILLNCYWSTVIANGLASMIWPPPDKSKDMH